MSMLKGFVNKISKREKRREKRRNEVLCDWVNLKLKSKGKEIKDIEKDFLDGVNLCYLYESISGTLLPKFFSEPKNEIEVKENLSLVLGKINQFIHTVGILVHYSPSQIMKEGDKSIISLLLILYKKFEIPSPKDVDENAEQKTNRMKNFAQNAVSLFKESFPVSIIDFGDSWKSGVAFLLIIHFLKADLVDLSTINPKQPKKNLELAFTVAEKIGIRRIIRVDDVYPYPNPSLVMMYVTLIYQYFVLHKTEIHSHNFQIINEINVTQKAPTNEEVWKVVGKLVEKVEQLRSEVNHQKMVIQELVGNRDESLIKLKVVFKLVLQNGVNNIPLKQLTRDMLRIVFSMGFPLLKFGGGIPLSGAPLNTSPFALPMNCFGNTTKWDRSSNGYLFDGSCGYECKSLSGYNWNGEFTVSFFGYFGEGRGKELMYFDCGAWKVELSLALPRYKLELEVNFSVDTEKFGKVTHTLTKSMDCGSDVWGGMRELGKIRNYVCSFDGRVMSIWITRKDGNGLYYERVDKELGDWTNVVVHDSSLIFSAYAEKRKFSSGKMNSKKMKDKPNPLIKSSVVMYTQGVDKELLGYCLEVKHNFD